MVGITPLRFPPVPLRFLGAHLIREAIVRKERIEDEGDTANPGLRFLAGLPRRFGYNLGPE